MAVTLCADLGPGLRKLPTVEWEMISLGKSQKREMTTYYLCEIQFPTTSPDVLQMEETTLSTTFLTCCLEPPFLFLKASPLPCGHWFPQPLRGENAATILSWEETLNGLCLRV